MKTSGSAGSASETGIPPQMGLPGRRKARIIT
jgi:hypothetical protein